MLAVFHNICWKFNVCAFNQFQSKPLLLSTSSSRVYGKSTASFLSGLAKKLVYVWWCQGASGSTSACPWLWSEGTLPPYWPVCKFDLILTIPSVLPSVKCYYPPLAFVSMHRLQASYLTYCFLNACVVCKFYWPLGPCVECCFVLLNCWLFWLLHNLWWSYNVTIFSTLLETSKVLLWKNKPKKLFHLKLFCWKAVERVHAASLMLPTVTA